MTTKRASVVAPVVAAPIGHDPDRRSLRNRLFYGLGSIAFGVKDNGFTYLLMIFYNQALGLSAASVGLAIMIALLVDAVFDPIIGTWSDNYRSRLGRRHPFMYVAALPIAISYFFLWSPPVAMGQSGLFWYLLCLSVVIRLCISLYEIPSSALVVDLAKDYDDRTAFLSYRYFFGWTGGLTMGILGFSVFLRSTADHPSGMLNLSGYVYYGMTASALMFSAIVASSLGTQRLASSSLTAERPVRKPLVDSVREIRQTLVNRAFLSIAGATLFSYAATGITYAALTYYRVFFWQLTGAQISFLMVGNFAAVTFGLFAAPKLAVALGKKRAVVLLYVVFILVTPLLTWGRLLDLVPANGSSMLYALLFTSSLVNTLLAVCIGVIGSSLLADVVEYTAVRTGRHAAGLIFSANAFLLKETSGIGAFGAGMILAFIRFPEGATPGKVPAQVLTRLGWTEPTVVLLLQLAALLLVSAYPITRSMHEANLRTLARNDGEGAR